jgi:tetratricopeptide (TPR) repeat protein
MHVEKTVFISYRRANTPLALAVFQYLSAKGFDVFYDTVTMKSGDFTQIIPNQVAARAHFVVLLTPNALERCNEPGDWVRREIEQAMDTKRNIVPLMFENFSFRDSKPYLTGKLSALASYNAIQVHFDYFQEALDRLREFLDIPLNMVLHPAPKADQAAVQKMQAHAAQQPPPTLEQLKRMSNDAVDKGYNRSFKGDYAGAVDNYNEAIRVKPDNAVAFYHRGNSHYNNKNYDSAIADFTEALRLSPRLWLAHHHRGLARAAKGDLDGALADYDAGISQAEEYETGKDELYISRGNIWYKKGKYAAAIADYTEAMRMSPDYAEYLAYRGNAYQANRDYALANADYQRYIDLGGKDASAMRDKIQANEKKLKKMKGFLGGLFG